MSRSSPGRPRRKDAEAEQPFRARVAAACVALLVLAASASGAGLVRRLGEDRQWGRCTLAGESRPAASCARLRHLASHKGRRVSAAGTVEVRLPAMPGGSQLLDIEAYTYGTPPRDKLLRRSLKNLSALLSTARENRALERLLARDPAFRLAEQARGVLVAQLPRTVTLYFDPAERERRAVFSVWAWTLPSPRVVLDAITPADGERLAISFGVHDRGWEAGPPVTFEVTATPAEGGAGTVIWRRGLDPARVERDRGWQEAELDLPAGGPVRLSLAATGPTGTAGVPAWGRPALLAPTLAEARVPPSILLLSIDTLRGDHLGAYGWRRATTPVIDRLAASGVLFEQAIAHFPSTTASHMTMLTSVAPCAHGVLGPHSTALGATIPTVTELLAAWGYATVGITEDGLIIGDLGFNRGFDSYRDLATTGEEPLGLFTRGIALARTWLERHGARPFFMFLHTYQVHVPYKVPPHLRRLFPVETGADEARRQEADYDAGLRYADELFGGFLSYLESSGLLAHTVLVVTSDHGTEFGEHGGIGHGRGVYEEQLRIPLVFHNPALAAAGRRVRAQVGLVDVAPTLLDIAGAPPSVTFSGRSLAPALRAADPGEATAPAIFAEQLWGPRETLLREGRYAWIQKQGGLELYDLEADPGEHRNLAGEAPDRTAEGARRIGEFREACRQLSLALHSGRERSPALDPERLRALRALGYVQ